MKNQVTSSQSIPKTCCEIHKFPSHLLPHHCLYTQLAACCLDSSPFCFAHGTEQNISSWSKEDHKASTVHLGIWFFLCFRTAIRLDTIYLVNFFLILLSFFVCVHTCVYVWKWPQRPAKNALELESQETPEACWDQTQVLCMRSKHS